MLRGQVIGLRARLDSDIDVLEAEMLNDWETRIRTDERPWRPIAPGSADSPYSVGHFFTTLTIEGLTGLLAALTVVPLAGGYVTVRRLTV
jgi:hypothetical protein